MKWIALALVVFGVDSGFAEVKYEKCAEHSISFTNKVVENGTYPRTEVGYCANCLNNDPFHSRSAFSTNKLDQTGKTNNNGSYIPKECFVSSISSRPKDSQKGKYRLCSANPTVDVTRNWRTYWQDKEKGIYVHRPCANEEYVNMIQRVLSDMSKCLKIPESESFALINHESRFILNNLSHSGARCFGQLTTDAVHSINKANHGVVTGSIDRSLSDDQEGLLKTDSLINRCPEAMKNFKPAHTYTKVPESQWVDSGFCKDKKEKYYAKFNRYWEEYKNGKITAKEFEGISIALPSQSRTGECVLGAKNYFQGDEPRCNILENPVTCMAYTLMYYNRNKMLAEAFISEEAKVLVTTNHMEEGMPQRPYIFKDQETFDDFGQRVQGTRYAELNTVEKPLFSDPEEIAKIVAQFSYNGGPVVANSYLRAILSRIRSQLDNAVNKELRKDWLDGGLSAEYFYYEMRKYIVANYAKHLPREERERRVEEVSNFVLKINKDLKSYESANCPKANNAIVKFGAYGVTK